MSVRRSTYEAAHDLLYVSVDDDAVYERSVERDGGLVIVDLDKEGRVIGVEVLSVKELPEP